MCRRFGTGNRTMPQRYVFDQAIQYEKPDHQNRTDEEYLLYPAEEGNTHILIQVLKDSRPILVAAEDRFQLGPQLRQQQRVGKRCHCFLRNTVGNCSDKVVMIMCEKKTAEDCDSNSASDRAEECSRSCRDAHVFVRSSILDGHSVCRKDQAHSKTGSN